MARRIIDEILLLYFDMHTIVLCCTTISSRLFKAKRRIKSGIIGKTFSNTHQTFIGSSSFNIAVSKIASVSRDSVMVEVRSFYFNSVLGSYGMALTLRNDFGDLKDDGKVQ